MNVVVLFRQPNAKIGYDRVLDHRADRVTYAGKRGRLAEMDVPARKVELDLDLLGPKTVPPELHEALVDCDVLLARSEFDLLRAAELREAYDIPGADGADVIPIRDKLIMRRRARAQGIDQPEFWSVPQFLQQARGGKFVLKPRRSGASNGIVAGDWAAIRARAEALAEHQDWLVEAYVPGEVYHVDGLMLEGEVALVQLSRYVNTCLTYTTGTPLGSVQVPNAAWTADLTRTIATCLGYRNGSFHLELIVDRAGGVQFLEFGGRVGAASVVETMELRTGLNLHACDLRQQLGHPTDWTARTPSPDFFGWFVFPFSALSSAAGLPDVSRFARHLHWYSKNDAPARPEGNSYHPDNSPLAGIVRGKHDEIAEVLRKITGHADS